MTDSTADAVKLLAQRILEVGYDDLPARERHVIERVAKRLAVSRNINTDYDTTLSMGDRLADRIAAFGGSWLFIIMFLAGVAAWVIANILILARWGGEFDPYPFILLNLFLSLVAAIQAPIIMMSQNRLAARDRLQAAHDYEVNLKAEIEIMALHEKLDELRAKELSQLVSSLKGSKGSR